jgi:cytochrome c biogenesis protein CcmG, thiol:disulfide interchange protein DsbE
MTLGRAAAVCAAAATLVVAGCTTDGSSGASDAAGSVDVASADLVRLKQRADMADCPPSDATRSPIDGGLPDRTLPCLGGGRDVRLAGLDGPLVANIWASYCAPCRDELPVLQQLHEAAGDRLTVIGVDYDDSSPGAALQLAAASGVTYSSVADPAADLRADLEVIALPQTVFVDASGKVVATERRPLTSFDMAADLVREHLGIELPSAS